MIKRNGRLFIDRGLTSSVPGTDIDKATEIIIRDPKTGDIKNTIKPMPVEFGLDHPKYSRDNNRTVFYSSPRMKYGGTIDADGSLNWGTVTGEAGYGLRDYSGKIQFKDSGGSWSDIDGKADDEGSYILTSADPDLANSRVLADDGNYLSLTDNGSNITVAWAKTNNISIWTNDSGYVTPSSTSTFTNKDGNISQWNNDSGFTTNAGTVTSVSNGDSTISVGGTGAAPTITVVEANFSGIPNTALANDGITIGGVSTDLGGSVSGDTIIGDVSAGGIGNSLLDNDSLTVTAGTGLSGGGEVSLGGEITLDNTVVASAVGGSSIWTSDAETKVLGGDETSAVFNFITNAAVNTDVVSSNSSGVYTVAGAGGYRVTASVTLKAAVTPRSGTGLVIKFTDGDTTDVSYASTQRECPTSGAAFEITNATYTFVTDSTTIEVLVISDDKSGPSQTDYALWGATEGAPVPLVPHYLEITRIA